MNRREFMNELRRHLLDLSEEDRMDALQYYNDYFEDAGADREQDIIRELGSPEAVAETIKRDLGMISTDSTRGEKKQSYDRQEDAYRQYQYRTDGAQNAAGSQSAYQTENQTGTQSKRNLSDDQKKLILILLLLSLPITGGPILGVIATIIGLIISVFAAAFGFYIGGFGCIAGGISLLISSAYVSSCVVFGIGFLLISIAILLSLLCSFVCRILIPTIIDGVRKLFRYFFQGGETVR